MNPNETLIEFLKRRVTDEMNSYAYTQSTTINLQRGYILEEFRRIIQDIDKSFPFEDEEYLFLEILNYFVQRKDDADKGLWMGSAITSDSNAYYSAHNSMMGILNEAGITTSPDAEESRNKTRKQFIPEIVFIDYLSLDRG